MFRTNSFPPIYSTTPSKYSVGLNKKNDGNTLSETKLRNDVRNVNYAGSKPINLQQHYFDIPRGNINIDGL